MYIHMYVHIYYIRIREYLICMYTYVCFNVILYIVYVLHLCVYVYICTYVGVYIRSTSTDAFMLCTYVLYVRKCCIYIATVFVLYIAYCIYIQ